MIDPSLVTLESHTSTVSMSKISALEKKQFAPIFDRTT